MNEMIERVAKAICTHFVRMWDAPYVYAVCEAKNWDGPPLKCGLSSQEANALARNLNARAAIEAMREPTKEMHLAAKWDPEENTLIIDKWHDMIDAALSPSKDAEPR